MDRDACSGWFCAGAGNCVAIALGACMPHQAEISMPAPARPAGVTSAGCPLLISGEQLHHAPGGEMTAAYRQQTGPLQDAETRASTPASWARPDPGGAGVVAGAGKSVLTNDGTCL